MCESALCENITTDNVLGEKKYYRIFYPASLAINFFSDRFCPDFQGMVYCILINLGFRCKKVSVSHYEVLKRFVLHFYCIYQGCGS